MSEQSYRPPVDQLLTLGEPKDSQDYQTLGIGPEQVPELILMVAEKALRTPPTDSSRVWAPVHAWRALGQLRAEAAIHPLLSLLQRMDEEQDDWIRNELPKILGKIGPAAIGPAADYLADTSHGHWARTGASEALSEIAQAYPESRAEVLSRLSAQLERFPETSEKLNAFLIWMLLDLRAVEAAPLMERAFAAERVDESVCGDWEEAQIALGLKSAREDSPKPNEFTEWGDQFRAALENITAPVQGSLGASSPYPDLKAINKARKQARSREKKVQKARILQRQRRH